MPSTSGGHDASDNNNNDDNDGGDDKGGESDDSSDSQGACSFLSPCVTTYRQLWLPDPPAHPHPRNSELRKQWYRKFWKFVCLFGATLVGH